MQFRGRVPAHPDVELLGFDDTLFLRGTPEFEFSFAKNEVDSLFRAGLQGLAFAAF